MTLIIVESPTKAKTLQGFLGRGYKVRSSFGHVRDLPRKELAVDIKNGKEEKLQTRKQRRGNHYFFFVRSTNPH